MFDRIETERLLLRRFQLQDREALFESLSDEETLAFEPYPPVKPEEMESLLAARIASPEFFAVEIKATGKVVGNVYLGIRDCDNAELGYVFNRRFWGKGYASEACGAAVGRAFQAGIHRVYAECDPKNVRSWKLLERLGFRREGFFRENVWFRKDEKGNPIWKDTYVYGRLAGE